jgi:hypothetical protein
MMGFWKNICNFVKGMKRLSDWDIHASFLVQTGDRNPLGSWAVTDIINKFTQMLRRA